MRQYTDMRGKSHPLEITLATRRMLRDQLNIDLVACSTDPTQLQALLTAISDDDYLLRVLAICEQTEVGELEQVFSDDTLAAAGDAFMEALTDFFRDSSPLKQPLRKLLDRLRTHMATHQGAAQEALTHVVETLDLSTVPSLSPTPTNGSAVSPPAADISTAQPGNETLSESCSGSTGESRINNS